MLASAVTFWRWLTGQPFPLDARGVPSDPAEERRVWLRFSANLNIRCEQVVGESEARVYAVISDISRGGVQMIAPRRFEPGTVLSVELPSPEGQTPLAVLACVIRAQPYGDSEWTMGCRFSSELNEEQLQAFGAVRARPTSPDPRNWERFACDAKAVYQRVSGDVPVYRPARVLNIAPAGIALLVDEEIAIGELLSTELHDPSGQRILTILACVVNVQTVAEGHRLGCNFIRELEDKDLHALL
jgi:hypothetical protein